MFLKNRFLKPKLNSTTSCTKMKNTTYNTKAGSVFAMPKQILLPSLLLFLLAGMAALLVAGNSSGWANRDDSGEIVFFNANWCASCRELLPMVQDIATSNQLGLTTIDVDADTAPKQARTLGLNLPKQGPPQVYYIHNRQQVLLYSGENYKFGYNTQARAAILQNLQQAAP
jgi:thiol-disulfide isomerase/thioredoxin